MATISLKKNFKFKNQKNIRTFIKKSKGQKAYKKQTKFIINFKEEE